MLCLPAATRQSHATSQLASALGRTVKSLLHKGGHALESLMPEPWGMLHSQYMSVSLVLHMDRVLWQL